MLCGAWGAEVLQVVRDRLYHVDPRPFRLQRCTTCQLVYLSPRPVPADLGRAYPPGYFWNHLDLRPPADARALVWNLWAGQLVARRVRQLCRLQARGPLLDVGCGAGLFLRAYQAATGQAVHGLDLQEKNFQKLLAQGIAAACGDFLTWDGPVGGFRTLTMWHLLEHLHDPLEALRRARHLLRPGGLLLIATQNFDALSRRLQGAAWTLLDVPRHLYHFTEATLADALARTGFAPVRSWHATELVPTLGAHLHAPQLLRPEGDVYLGRALAAILAWAPLEALALGLHAGCTFNVAARRLA